MDGSEIPRRRVLRGAAGWFGVRSGRRAQADRSDDERSARYNVGTSSGAATRAARARAERVVGTIELAGEQRAVVGVYSEGAVEDLRDRAGVRYVERDERLGTPRRRPIPSRTPERTTPGDGTVLSKEAPTAPQVVPWGVERIGAETAREKGVTGSGVDVTVLDTGVDRKHPDLRENLGEGKAFVDYRDSDEWGDDHGHGTHSAGIVAALDNDRGVLGAGSSTTIHAVKVLDSNNVGPASAWAAGVIWSALRGYDIVNMSLGSGEPSRLLGEAIKYARKRGTLFVAAAGNGGPCDDCVDYPAAYPGVIGVGAVDRDDDLPAFSATGSGVELVAPGTNVLSTVPDGYSPTSGTSNAAPHVTALLALLLEQGYDPDDARRRLRETAVDLGFDGRKQGHGLVDGEAALFDPGITALDVDGDGPSVDSRLTLQIRANTLLDDAGPSSSGEPYFEVAIDGTTVARTDLVEPDPRYRGTITIEKSELDRVEAGRGVVTVTLRDAVADERIAHQSVVIGYVP